MPAPRPAAKRSSLPNEIPRRRSSLANRARGGLPSCANASPRAPIAWNAGLPMQPRLKKKPLFDLALADVPCSGTGTLGRNPEIRHRLHLEDLPRHAERQRAILRAALRAVRPGGRVVYSTCSLEPEENEQVVAAVLAENSECAADFGRASHRDAATEWHSSPRGRGAVANMPHARRRTALIAGHFADRRFLCCADRKNRLTA